MKRLLASGWQAIACLLCVCWAVCLPAHAAIRVVDDQGTLVTLTAPPQRVVSLLPSLTESVCVLGACHRLVATDRWSNWPESVRGLPKLGGLDDANLELILVQRPDLVLLSASNRLAGRLRALGLTVAELDAEDLPQVQRLLTKVAALLGAPQQAALQWQAIETEIRTARAMVPKTAQGTRVYFEVSSALYAAGEVSYIGQLLSTLGAVNVVGAKWGPFPKLNPEFVVQAQPDLIMLSAAEAPGLIRRPGWSHMKAVSQGRICAMPQADYDLLSRPGPRLGAAAKVLAQCLAKTGGAR
jgi:iron complex transport system substrate-binding protein